jgi:putative transcriptional regulator
MSNWVNRQIAERLKDLRLDLGLTQDQLAQYAGIDRKTVNRIENEHFSPSIDTLFRLATVFGVHPSEILKGIYQ